LEVAEDSRDLVRSGSFSHESLPGSLPVVRFPLRLDQVLGGRPAQEIAGPGSPQIKEKTSDSQPGEPRKKGGKAEGRSRKVSPIFLPRISALYGPRRTNTTVKAFRGIGGDRGTAAGRSPGCDQTPAGRLPLPPPSFRGSGSSLVGSGFLGLTPPGYELAPLKGLGNARQRKQDERKLDARPTFDQPSRALPRTLSVCGSDLHHKNT